MRSEPQRIGIFGGTFDPPHNAHVDIARAALQYANLDKVVFVVAANPPHKPHEEITDAEDRLAMVKAVLPNDAPFEASRLEIDRPGPSYTVDTLNELDEHYRGAAFFLIVGYDSLLDLPKWRNPEAILARARLLVIPRPGERKPPPPFVEGRYELLPFEERDLSSTEVRSRLEQGQPVRGLVPDGVCRVIKARGLYGVDTEQS